MKRIMVLSDKGPASYYLINRLLSNNWSVYAVFENRSFDYSIKILKSRIKRLGVFGVLNQIILSLYTKFFEKPSDDKNILKIFNDQPTTHVIKDIMNLEVQNINDAKVHAFIGAVFPDLVIVNGTSIIKPATIELTHGKTLNIHVGITPEYRGTHGGFWALHNKQSELAGVTVHLINEGIDTGAIFAQKTVELTGCTTLRSMAYLQQKVGIDLIMDKIDDLCNGRIIGYHKPDSTSKLYYSPGITHYFKYILAKGKK